MDIQSLKAQILDLKLKLYKIQQEKNECVRCSLYEKAMSLREKEKQVKEQLEHAKYEILRVMNTYKPEHSDLEDYLMLQSLLFEFHPLEFQSDCEEAKTKEAIDQFVARYWNIREQMQEELLKYLREEYEYVREQMQQFKHESEDDKVLRALNRLATIDNLMHAYKKRNQ